MLPFLNQKYVAVGNPINNTIDTIWKYSISVGNIGIMNTQKIIMYAIGNNTINKSNNLNFFITYVFILYII